MYCARGKLDDASKEIKVALSGAPDNQKSSLDGMVIQLEAKQDINQQQPARGEESSELAARSG
jgi:hypothetical protein